LPISGGYLFRSRRRKKKGSNGVRRHLKLIKKAAKRRKRNCRAASLHVRVLVVFQIVFVHLASCWCYCCCGDWQLLDASLQEAHTNQLAANKMGKTETETEMKIN